MAETPHGSFNRFPPFPDAVLVQTREVRLSQKLYRDRREVTGFTVDGVTSKDLDDAIWIDEERGGKILRVSIADVASLIHMGTPIDEEALKRGYTNYYGSRHNSPMIPAPISENLLSLLEGKQRPTVTISVPIELSGDHGKGVIEQTYIASRKKCNYDEVDDAIRDSSSHPMGNMLKEYYQIASGLLSQRRAQGALAIYDLFKGFATNEEGELENLVDETRHMANIIIQEFMILANQSVAQYCAENDLPALFRNHTAKLIAPDRNKLIHDLDEAMLYPGNFDIETVRKRVGMSLNRAFYGPELVGHFGLNLPAYAHFTSPIRRYADLVNHRQVIASINGVPAPYSVLELQDIGEHLYDVDPKFKGRSNRKRSDEMKGDARVRKVSITVDKPERPRVVNVVVVPKGEIKRNDVSEENEALTIASLKEGKLPLKTIKELLLNQPEQTESLARVQAAIIEWLRENPHQAAGIANLAQQTLGWPAIDMTTVNSGSPHLPVYSTVGVLRLDDADYVSPQIDTSSLKASQQLAIVEILSQMVVPPKSEQDDKENGEEEEVHDEPEDAAIKTVAQTTPPAPSPEYKRVVVTKNTVQELCDKQGWPYPTYELQMSGPPHNRRYTVRGHITIGSEVCYSEPVTAATIREAERLAAEQLHPQLESLKKAVSREVVIPTVEVINGDTVSAIHMLAQKKHWRRPSFETQRKGEDVTVILRFYVGKELHTETAVGLNEKEAKRQVSSQMLESLSGLDLGS